MGNADSKNAAAVDDQETIGTATVTESKSTMNNNNGKIEYTSYDGADERSRPEKRESNRTRRNGNSGRDQADQITDDQINVNMPMADLMAYLQVVANNSNHLPLTRRDDPELDRTVSTLSAEEYARKSAAFIPSDVRVIGATFSRYGRVWDLPTREEYNACDGAQEPGKSYGGACCNTMLKAVYDAANLLEGAAQTEAATNAMFDDDEEDEEPSITGRSYKSGFSLEYGNPNQTHITWAALLRQMKSEMKEIGYAQYPKITTTRKIDLNKPFTLTPDGFDPKKNKKRALLIGCNYHACEGAELHASHDDVRSMKDYIVNVHGFSENNEMMTILLDDENYTPPTFMNIIEAFKKLSEDAQPGDAVFVQFSGHGGRVLDAHVDSEAESYDEVIVPSDYLQKGLIRDTLIFKTLLAPMRYGVTVTIVIDCCDTGMVLELPYSWSSKSKDSNAKLTTNDDFSFVRFLKVVKTLYESSTFTQLGKTVGSALNPLGSPGSFSKDDDGSRKSGKSGKKSNGKSARSSGTSIFDALADACNSSSRHKNQSSSLKRNDTLFEQVMKGCTLLSASPEEALSDDEETFKTRTEDDTYYSGGESTFETLTDDGYDTRRRSRRSSRRR